MRPKRGRKRSIALNDKKVGNPHVTGPNLPGCWNGSDKRGNRTSPTTPPNIASQSFAIIFGPTLALTTDTQSYINFRDSSKVMDLFRTDSHTTPYVILQWQDQLPSLSLVISLDFFRQYLIFRECITDYHSGCSPSPSVVCRNS